MAVKTIKAEPMAVKADVQGDQKIWTIAFNDGSRWTGIYSPYIPFSICGDKGYSPVTSSFFKKLMADMISFFKSGEVSFDTGETLKAMRIRDGILNACSMPGDWLNV